MGYNSGFARANNKGIQISSFATVLLLNADTLIENNAITTCYDAFVKSNFAACGIQLLNFDRTHQTSGSYVVKGGLNYLLLLPFSGTFIGLLAKAVKLRKPSIVKADAIQEVDWINGAFLMFNKDIAYAAGLMDEDFFLYMEEIEWCSRLRKHGKLCVYGEIHSIHLQGVTTGEHFNSRNKGYQNLFDKMGQQMMLSIWVRQRKEFGVGWLLFLVVAYVIGIPFFFVSLCFAKVFFYKIYTFRDFYGYTKNIFKNMVFLRTIVRNTPCFYKVV